MRSIIQNNKQLPIELNINNLLPLGLRQNKLLIFNSRVNELQTLEYIALLTPWIGGESVYSARILLGIDPDNHGIAYRLPRDSAINSDGKGFKIFPNPTKDYCNIKFESKPKGNISICITDLTGKQINCSNQKSKEILHLDISQLKAGIYFVKIQNEYGFNEIEKLIIY